jgi:hypothetical protein
MAKDNEPQQPGESLADLKRHSQELKDRIEEQRRKSAMPINGSLGNPQIDAENADGRRDLPDDDEN